jgi:hypothetical protein
VRSVIHADGRIAEEPLRPGTAALDAVYWGAVSRPLLWTFSALAAGACSGDGGPPSVGSPAPTLSDRCAAQDGPVADTATLTMGPAPGLPSTSAAFEPLEIVGTIVLKR